LPANFVEYFDSEEEHRGAQEQQRCTEYFDSIDDQEQRGAHEQLCAEYFDSGRDDGRGGNVALEYDYDGCDGKSALKYAHDGRDGNFVLGHAHDGRGLGANNESYSEFGDAAYDTHGGGGQRRPEVHLYHWPLPAFASTTGKATTSSGATVVTISSGATAATILSGTTTATTSPGSTSVATYISGTPLAPTTSFGAYWAATTSTGTLLAATNSGILYITDTFPYPSFHVNAIKHNPVLFAFESDGATTTRLNGNVFNPTPHELGFRGLSDSRFGSVGTSTTRHQLRAAWCLLRYL
jgi:hypothetical protein